MQIPLRLCLAALLLNLGACAQELDQTRLEQPSPDDRVSDDPLDEGRLDSQLPSNASPSDGHCIAQPDAGRFSLCGSLSGMPGASVKGTAIAGSTLRFAPVRSETHILGGEIRAH